ncbi:MAG: restriction endonuclease subunit S [Methanobacteriota archaeon]
MKPETFFDNFEALADAPNGVQKLRELILQLAVRGKLVAQDEKDEPASVFIKKEQNAKKIISAPIINNDEKPFLLPKGWVFARLSEIGKWAIGNGFPTSEQGHEGKSILFCKVSDMNLEGNEKWIQTTVNTIDEEIADRIRARVHPTGTVIFPKIGGAIATNKRRIIIKPTAIDNNCLGIIPYSFCNSDWLYLLLKSMDFTKYQSGTSVPALNQGTLELIITGLPPLAEQHRIVAKVDQLMSLCDELESRQQKKRESRAHLNSAALDRLLAARAPGEFAEGWRRISDNFDLLYDAPENVGALRQAILQLAVMGKLVAQDSNDEPAAVLLEKIKAQKEQLVKEKKIKRAETLVERSDVPFELPKGWNWVSMGNALLKLTDGTHNSPPNYETGDFKYVTAKNIKNKGIDLTNITYITTAVHNEIYSRCDPEPGDILYIKDGATTGIAAINDITEPFSMLSSVALLKTPTEIYNRYLLYILRSPYFYSMMRDDMSGVAITRVTLTKLNKALIPLAPLAEQRRIVARVDLLMSLCDKLEAGLMRSQADSERLMEAVVGRMLA